MFMAQVTKKDIKEAVNTQVEKLEDRYGGMSA